MMRQKKEDVFAFLSEQHRKILKMLHKQLKTVTNTLKNKVTEKQQS